MRDNNPVFYLPSGMLTQYGLACGYVERFENGINWKELYHEHNTYHVRSGVIGQQYSTWESFEKLTPARLFYKSIKF